MQSNDKELTEQKLNYETSVYDEWYGKGNITKPFFYHNPKFEERFVKSMMLKFKICSGLKLIDIGCGNGLYSNIFNKHGIIVTSVDISKNAIDYCIKSYDKTINWICGDAFSLSYQDEFDFGFCNFFTFFNAFEIPKEASKYACKLMDYIKPGGLLFFIWISDLSAVRLSPERFNIMNFTIHQLEAFFSGYHVESYAIDSSARQCFAGGQFVFNKYITRLNCSFVHILASSWRRVRIITVVHK